MQFLLTDSEFPGNCVHIDAKHIQAGSGAFLLLILFLESSEMACGSNCIEVMLARA